MAVLSPSPIAVPPLRPPPPFDTAQHSQVGPTRGAWERAASLEMHAPFDQRLAGVVLK
jgi:hypothetical protein